MSKVVASALSHEIHHHGGRQSKEDRGALSRISISVRGDVGALGALLIEGDIEMSTRHEVVEGPEVQKTVEVEAVLPVTGSQ